MSEHSVPAGACPWPGSDPGYRAYHDNEWGKPVPEVVAAFGLADVERLLTDVRIIRHRGKIEATIANARLVLTVAEEIGSFDAFVWGFAPESHRRPRRPDEIPSTTPAAVELAKALKKRGARFVWSDDHLCVHAGDGTGERPSDRLPIRRCDQVT